jgi:hypothetical protein
MRLVSFILFSVIALASSAPSAVASTPSFARGGLGMEAGSRTSASCGIILPLQISWGVIRQNKSCPSVRCSKHPLKRGDAQGRGSHPLVVSQSPNKMTVVAGLTRAWPLRPSGPRVATPWSAVTRRPVSMGPTRGPKAREAPALWLAGSTSHQRPDLASGH